MKKIASPNVMRTVLMVLLASVLLVSTIAAPTAQAATMKAAYIEKMENAPAMDLEKYLDSSVMFALPENIRDDEEISVIITVDAANLMDAYEGTDKTMSFTDFAHSAEAAAIEAAIAESKARILKTLDEQGIAYKTGADYAALLSGFELVIQARDYAVTCMSLGAGESAFISEEYRVAETQLVENTVNVYETGIFKSGDSGYDGSGTVVAVLDTGLDSNHTAFSPANFTSDKLALTYDDVAKVIKQTKAYELSGSLSADDVYINEKVPFGYDYADNDPDPYSTHNNHGTHVSGVIVGKDDTITGVAPNAQLVTMKVFSDVMDTARASWILDALEDCVVLGVDAINMSLGTACGFAREGEEELAYGVYEKIRNAGISMIVAASNSYSSAYGSEKNGNLGLTSNPDTGTVGSPGTYDGVMSVASINGVETPYLLHEDTIIYFDESNTASGEENHFVENLLGDKDSADVEFVLIPGVGRSADYAGLDMNGKIALVRRGDNTFEEKALIAEAQGAIGIIIYNNVSGEIKMNVGDAKLATCSISQDDGETLAALGTGKLKISKDQTSGPFISDFSSWGPTPSLEIKPEITAHGGNILSSVTGGSYDRLSGTSMACPNMAGVVLLMRQYVMENFPDIANDDVAVNAMANRLMMSTADIIINTNGLPYAVRKQGAGLANLLNSINTTAYIVTKDESGKDMDKTKLELGDDPDKSGVYTMDFTVRNFGDKSLTYDIGAYVMTEGVSDTKTSAGETTITEVAHILEGAAVEIASVEGGKLSGTKLTVDAGSEADVSMTITLSETDKAYLDASFENGMYVEGFITLTAAKGTDIDLSVPYLAFYGNWNQAPLFDLDYYATNADELDDSIAVEDKTMADAYATRPIGGVSEDYVSYLGSYYFLQDPKDMIISADRDYIALSNKEGTIHSLRFVWAGLLRNAQRIEITVTDDTTGEVIFETVDTDVRKSYGDGGSIYPANVEIEFDTMEFNLSNNTQYTVKLQGYLDYGDGGVAVNENTVFEFPLTVDFEAPTLTDVEFYYEFDDSMDKNRLYAKAAIFDNHHAMSAQLGYVSMGADEEGNEMAAMKSFEQYMTPIYSQRNATTYVTFELTDYIHEIKANALNGNCFSLTLYDYALNYATYEVGLPDSFTDFYLAELLEEEPAEETAEVSEVIAEKAVGETAAEETAAETVAETVEETVAETAAEETAEEEKTGIQTVIENGLTLSPYEVYNLAPLVYPETEWGELLEFSSSRPSVARVVNDKIVAASTGKAVIKVRDPATNNSITFPVTVLGEEDEGYRRYDKPVADVFRLNGFETLKAYYIIDSEDKKLGDTGDTRFFEGNFELSMYPSECVRLNYDLDAFFPNDTKVEFASSNENIVTIDENGTVTAVEEGFASVTIKVMMDDRSTYYSETVSVEVKDPFITTGASLTHYYGNGGLVTIPTRLKLQEIGSFAFSNFEYIPKTAEELAFDDAETSKQWYIGEGTVTKVIIPEGVEKINSYAFANLTGLEEVVLPSTLQSIEYGAFYGCTALEKISFSSENNLQIISKNAFENCALKGTLDLSSICVISDYAFAGNTKLEGIQTGDSLLSIGKYAFAGCKQLKDVTIVAPKVKYGTYAFTGCEALESFYVNAAVLPEGMFYEAKNMEAVTIGPDVNTIGEFAFRDTKIASFEISVGNKAYKVQKADHILSADGKTLAAVSPLMEGAFTSANIGGAEVTALANGAFSHNTKLESVELPKVTVAGDYAFGSSERITSVTLGQLTKIGEYAFFETGITEMPQFTVDTEIGKYAFSFTDLTSVTIPDGMTVAEGVFSECLKLENVTIGNDVTLEKFAFNMTVDNIFEIKNYNEDGEKYFYYEFVGGMKNLTIGDNAVIGENAFSGNANLETVTLGAGADIGYMAFYNTSNLKEIDLSQAKKIGDYALSGDVYYVCVDDAMAYAAVSSEGKYIYSYHGPQIQTIDLAAAESIGEYAFSYCRELTDVKLNETITEIPQYAFAGCVSLKNIDLSKIVTVGDYAFIESAALEAVDLSAAETIGEYAFVYCSGLKDVTLSENGTDIGEGTFSYCEALPEVKNLNAAKNIGAYGFAYTAIDEADLSGAVVIDDFAFLKEELTPFRVTLGENLETLGDNPFAMCLLEPFAISDDKVFNGKTYNGSIHTFDISENVKVIDGSLYCKKGSGMELIAYAGIDPVNTKVADGTVRITAHAFAGADVQMVTLPHTTTSIGHKAFYLCDDLHTVVFGSYYAPILEEEFDGSYYESFTHVPGTGDFGEYTDYDGNQVQITGTGMLPYYMWNATDGLYSNVFYGANFVDYVGYVEDKLTMVRPVNGEGYDSYIYGQYFDMVIDGAQAADKVTLAAIAAIDAIPERVTYEDRALVEAARAAYTKIATTMQQAQVRNYADLISAEQRITALTPTEEGAVEETAPTEEAAPEKTEGGNGGIVAVILLLAAAGCGGFYFLKKRKAAPKEEISEEVVELEETSGEADDAADSQETEE